MPQVWRDAQKRIIRNTDKQVVRDMDCAPPPPPPPQPCPGPFDDCSICPTSLTYSVVAHWTSPAGYFVHIEGTVTYLRNNCSYTLSHNNLVVTTSLVCPPGLPPSSTITASLTCVPGIPYGESGLLCTSPTSNAHYIFRINCSVVCPVFSIPVDFDCGKVVTSNCRQGTYSLIKIYPHGNNNINCGNLQVNVSA